MSTTMSSRSSATAAPGPARQAVASVSERRDPLRRRWGRVGGGALAAVVGGWLFASLYLSAGDRQEVLAVATGVERFDAIERSDLRVVTLPTDAQVDSVAASRLQELVGRVAGTELTAGSLLAERQLLPPGERLVAADEAMVGVLVGPGDAPVNGLEPGAAVLVVTRPPVGVAGEVTSVAGWVVDVPGAASASGDRPIELVVPRADAASVSASASDRRVTIVVVGG